MSEFVERLRQYLRTLPRHVRERKAAQLLAEAADEIEHLQHACDMSLATTEDALQLAAERNKEIERLRDHARQADDISMCRSCHRLEPACDCTHTTTDSWMGPEETVSFLVGEIERLRKLLRAKLDRSQPPNTPSAEDGST